MRAFGQNVTAEEEPIAFSRKHRVALLATAWVLVVVVPVMAANGFFSARGVLPSLAMQALGVALLVGVLTCFAVLHAVLILAGSPERRVSQNVVPTVIAVGSLGLVAYLVAGALLYMLPQ